MRFTTHINNQKCLEWGLNANQGAMFDLLNQVAAWATPTVIDGETFYWVARAKVIEELPLFYAKADTVYRHFVVLVEKGLIVYLKHDNKDLIKLTEKGKEWNTFGAQVTSESAPDNSDSNPRLGNKSEQTRKQIRKSSDSNPTDKYINNKNITDQKIYPQTAEVLDYLNTELATLAASRGERKPSGFKPTTQTLSTINARLGEFSVDECRRVVDYLVTKWGNDPKMSEYLRPSTIFRPTNFAEYVTLSDVWDAKGRPRCEGGNWVFADGRTKPISNVPDPFNPPKNRKLVVDRRWTQPIEESPYALSNFT